LRNKLYHILALILAVTLNSCLTVNYLQVQIAEPGKEDLPPDIQSLTLVNRAVDGRFENISEDSLQLVFYRNQFNLDTVIYDLTAADTLVKALGELLYESGRYDIVIPENRFLQHERNSFFSMEMPWNEVDELCKTFKTDAVISLDHFKTSISTSYDTETLYDGEEDRYYKAYTALIAIQYEGLIRVYDPAKKQVINRTFLKDTLIWDDADYSNRALFSRLTSVKKALIETGIAVALDYSDRISTKWRNETRKYYKTGNPLFEQADTFALKNDWENALDLWLEVANQAKGKSLKSKAEYNTALGYEMLGDIDESIRWGVQSYKTQYRPLTVEYLNILKKRKEQLEKISKNE
jgi:hypothetical protein